MILMLTVPLFKELDKPKDTQLRLFFRRLGFRADDKKPTPDHHAISLGIVTGC
jgi:hypothetical protein